MQTGYLTVVQFSTAEISAGAANNMPATTYVLDTTTGVIAQGNPSGAPGAGVGTGFPKVRINSANVALTFAAHSSKTVHAESGASLAALLASNWTTEGMFYLQNHTGANLLFTVGAGFTLVELGNADVAAGFTIPDKTEALVKVNTDGFVQIGISSQMVTQSELDLKADIGHAHAQSDVTGLTAALTAKQDTLVSGTNVKTVNGTSILGSGNVAVAADLPGGAATTVTDEGLSSGTATIDRTTRPGKTILRYATVGTTTLTLPNGITVAEELLVVAGGGGGGVNHGGGGGGGEVRSALNFTIGTGAHSIVIGDGGASGNNTNAAQNVGFQGGDTRLGTLIDANGGGGGGSRNNAQVGSVDLPGGAGGSGGGGGGSKQVSTTDSVAGGASSLTGSGVGFTGGLGSAGASSPFAGNGGGGGGASATPTAATGTADNDGNPGNGGTGINSSITGASVGYSGGGGGGRWSSAASPTGSTATHGGGAGGNKNGVAGSPGTANTGGGGGGGGGSTPGGGKGGSGTIVIVWTTQTRSYQNLQSHANNADAKSNGGLLAGQFYTNTTVGAIAQVN